MNANRTIKPGSSGPADATAGVRAPDVRLRRAGLERGQDDPNANRAADPLDRKGRECGGEKADEQQREGGRDD